MGLASQEPGLYRSSRSGKRPAGILHALEPWALVKHHQQGGQWPLPMQGLFSYEKTSAGLGRPLSIRLPGSAHPVSLLPRSSLGLEVAAGPQPT